MTTISVPVRPAPIAAVNAGSFIEVPFVCVDRQLAPITPSAIRYRIDNITDGVLIKAWTSVSAAQSGSIVVTAALNAMSRSWRQQQINQVTIEFTTATGIYQDKKLYELYAVNVAAAS